MIRSLSIVLFCMTLAACNGGGDSQPASQGGTGVPSGTGNGGGSPAPSSNADPAAFDPTAMRLDAPPTDGKLPAELLPPA